LNRREVLGVCHKLSTGALRFVNLVHFLLPLAPHVCIARLTTLYKYGIDNYITKILFFSG
jgi:hypothetical protein